MAVFLRRLSKSEREARNKEVERLYDMGLTRNQIRQQVSLSESGLKAILRKKKEKNGNDGEG